MTLAIIVNGQDRSLTRLVSPTNLLEVIREMGLKADRVAVEHNGELASRARWAEVTIHSGDRLEVVQFVGGGGTRLKSKQLRSRHKTVRTATERSHKGLARPPRTLTIHNICYQTWNGWDAQ